MSDDPEEPIIPEDEEPQSEPWDEKEPEVEAVEEEAPEAEAEEEKKPKGTYTLPFGGPKWSGPGLDWRDIGRAMKEANGDQKEAAKALGISHKDIAARVAAHPTLRALYSDGERTTIGTEDIFDRRAKDSPLASDLTPDELASAIMKQDRELQIRGLKELGVQEKTIEKLRSLDGLAKNMGKHLSISLQTSYQMLALQQIRLFEETESIRDQLQSTQLPPDQKLHYWRLYLDMIRETNRGHQTLYASSEALVRMMSAARGRPIDANQPPPEKKKGKKQKVGFHVPINV